MVPKSLPRPGVGPIPVWQNQRATVRYHCAPATPARLLLHEDLEFQRGWVLNISLGGLALQVARPLQTGALAALAMTGASSKKTYELAVHVVYCAQQPSGGEWIAGLEFVQQLTADDLDDLLS